MNVKKFCEKRKTIKGTIKEGKKIVWNEKLEWIKMPVPEREFVTKGIAFVYTVNREKNKMENEKLSGWEFYFIFVW